MSSKRALDLGLLLPVLPLYALLTCALALVVWLCDGRPVFFLQQRAGRGLRPFAIFKLRTMTTEADPKDRRPTRLGAFLRRRGLDELPQLWNILFGHMSLVGPRPLSVEDAHRLVAAHPPFASRFDARPGLTGPAQVLNLRGVQRTAEVEAAYAAERTAFGDVALLARTVWINVAGKPRAIEATEAASTPRRRRRWPALLGAALLLPMAAVGEEVDRLSRLVERGGADAFRPVDLASAGALDVVMALGGFAFGYAQVAKETLLLFVPSDTGERDFQSDFALRAPEVRTAARVLAERLARGEVQPSVEVRLDGPLAVRLAFSIPFELSAERTEAGVAFTARTAIVYPRRAVLPLGPVRFDEGIFWALQERGWFHPYHARWHWTLKPGDPRWERAPGGPSWREAATVAVWRAALARR